MKGGVIQWLLMGYVFLCLEGIYHLAHGPYHCCGAELSRSYAPAFFRLLYRSQHVLEGAKTTSRPPIPCFVHHNSTAPMISVSSLPNKIPLLSCPALSIDLTDSAHPQLVLDPELRPKSFLHPQLLHQYSRLLNVFEVRAGFVQLPHMATQASWGLPWWTYQKWYYCKSTLFSHRLCNDTIWWTTSLCAQVMHPSLHCCATYCLWRDICDHSDYRYACFTFRCVNVEHIKLIHCFSIASCCASRSWVSCHYPVIDTATNSDSAMLSVLWHGVRNS